VICGVLRDLAGDVERNEICENEAQVGAEAAQCTPLRAMWKSEKMISKSRQRHSFHKKRFL
jgi:hypothetical protein